MACKVWDELTSITQIQRSNRLGLIIDKKFNLTLYSRRNYFSMLRFKLNQVSKGVYR